MLNSEDVVEAKRKVPVKKDKSLEKILNEIKDQLTKIENKLEQLEHRIDSINERTNHIPGPYEY